MTSWTQLTREQQIAQLEKDWAENPRWKGIKRGYSAADVVRLRGLDAGRAHPGAARRREAVEPDQHRAVREHAGRAHRQPGHAAGQGRPQGHLSFGLAGRGRRQQQRRDVPGSVALFGGLGAEGGQEDQFDVHPGRPDPVERRQEPRRRGLRRLLRAHRGRCRSRFRRRAQRVRADEGHDRGGRRRRPLRGPAGIRQEVRPHGRQGAGAHPRSVVQAGRRPPGGGRDGHTHHPAGAHRRRGR